MENKPTLPKISSLIGLLEARQHFYHSVISSNRYGSEFGIPTNGQYRLNEHLRFFCLPF